MFLVGMEPCLRACVRACVRARALLRLGVFVVGTSAQRMGKRGEGVCLSLGSCWDHCVYAGAMVAWVGGSSCSCRQL